ncbi:MAG TPA: hypothetical protein VH081_11900 [Solirubrobacteraceae bacterium]|nr:hypothetical protein [Solirubrobacteraceae bacterium]
MTSAAGAADRRSAGEATERLARTVFALLVLACLVAFFLTQHLKHTPTAVQRFELTPFFSPTPSGHIKEARISFKLSHADEATVTILSSSGATVATLLRDYPIARYKQFSLRWSGRRGTARGYKRLPGPDGGVSLAPRLSGALAPAGEYRVRVSLREQHRSVLSPRGFKLVLG